MGAELIKMNHAEFPAIVTKFHLNTRPLLSTVKRCTYIWPSVCYEMVFKWVLEVSNGVDETQP